MTSRSPSAPAWLRRIGVIAFIAAVVACAPAAAAPLAGETGFVRRTFRDAAGEHGYVVYVPADYTPDRAWPVMLFLHGAGERGNDGFRQAEVGLGPMIRRWGSFPWVVVFPQAEDTRGAILNVWAADAPDGKRALAILDEVERTYRTDPNRRVLTGWSMGGRGAYMLAAAYPEKWSAVAPVSGWADVELAPQLAKVPLWSFHGTADTLVSYEEDKALVERTREAGGKAWFTTFPEGDHYIWRTVYASSVLFEWMGDPSRFAGHAEPPELNPLATVEMSRSETNGPFVPGLELDNAVAIRIGPDLFHDLSEATTKEMAAKPLTGTMPGTSTESKQAGITFKVRTSQISYRVPVTKAEVVPTEQGTLRIRVEVTKAQLLIGRTDVRGLICTATGGPMCVVLGHRRPIPVEVEAVPYVTENEFRLRAKSVRFAIPNGDWYTTRPAVDSHCLLLPEGRVADSLVEGVYSSKGRIERDFRKAVTEAVNKLKMELPPVTDDQLLTALWPVPAYRPRIKPRLQDVAVDVDGMSVVFGMTVAAVDPYGPQRAAKRIDLGLTPQDAAVGDVAVTAAEDLVEPITEQLVEAGLAHVNVLDIPDHKFAHMADREVLAGMIPAVRQLPETAEFRTELYLRKPVDLAETEDIRQVCDPSGCEMIFDLRVPEIAAVISVRDSAGEGWRDYAEFSYAVTQPTRMRLSSELAEGREVITACNGAPDIRTTPRWLMDPPADDRLDAEAARRVFEEGWSAWSNICGPTAFRIPDLALKGYVRRLDRLEPGPKGMAAVFEEPETVLSNKADEPLVYRTRKPGGSWGSSLTLPPGERHVYRVSQPLGYAGEAGDATELYEIPPGRDATFKPLGDGRTGLVLDPLPVPLEPRENVPGTGNSGSAGR